MAVTNFIWDELSDNVRMEIDEAGAVTAEFMNKPDHFGGLLSQRRNSTNSFFHFDAQGSTRQITDNSKVVTDTYAYSLFGTIIASSGTTKNPFKFNGESGYYSNLETDDVYVRHRAYNSALARWLSADPLFFADIMNRYIYARNNSSALDPTGLITITLRHKLWPLVCDERHTVQHNFSPDKKLSGFRPCFWVQRVQLYCLEGDCDCYSCEVPTDETKPAIDFLEAWEVRFPDFVKGEALSEDHLFDLIPWYNQCGHHHFVATVKIFCGIDIVNTIKEWDKDGKIKTHDVDVCGYNLVTNRHTYVIKSGDSEIPPFWNDSIPKDGPDSYDFSLDWNCCDGQVHFIRPETTPDNQ